METIVRPTPVNGIDTELFRRLGHFWTRLYSDTDFVKNYCKGEGLLAAQTYISYLEAAGVLGISSIPVFKRENWTPIVIRKSERNTGAGVALYIGIPEINIGPQEDNSYRENREFSIGGSAVRDNMVSYPARARAFKDGINQICSSILSPKKTLLRGVDYFINEGTIVFIEDVDPFNALNDYPIRVIENAETGETDTEIVLWGSDALYDKEFIYEHFGYVTGYKSQNNATYLKVTQALWDLRVAGNDIARQNLAVGDFFDVAAIRNDVETVESIITKGDKTQVITDKNVYAIGPNETIRSVVSVGASLVKGTYLTETIRTYRKLNSEKFFISNDRSLEQFLNDVPRLYLPKGLIGVPELTAGFGLGWEEADLIYEGDDGNGNPKLKFVIDATEEDEVAYWNAVWSQAEADGIDMGELLSQYITNDNPLVEGQVVGSINPLKFFMDNFLRANLSVIVVDFDALPEYITSFEPLTRLEGLIPSHTAIILVIRKALEEEDYNMTFNAKESLEVHNGIKLAETAEFDADPATGLTYINDQLKIRWVRVCN